MESLENNMEIHTENIDDNININNINSEDNESLTQCQDDKVIINDDAVEEMSYLLTEEENISTQQVLVSKQKEKDIEKDQIEEEVVVEHVISDFNSIFNSPIKENKSLNDSIFSPFLSDADKDDSQSNSLKTMPLIDKVSLEEIGTDDLYDNDEEDNNHNHSSSEPTMQQLSQDIFGFDDDSNDYIIKPKEVSNYNSSNNDDDEEEERTQAQNDSDYLSSDSVNNVKKKKKSKKEIRREKRAEKKEKKEAKKAAKIAAKLAANENNSDESEAEGGGDAATDVDSSDYDTENNSGDDEVVNQSVKEIKEKKTIKENKKSAVETEIEVVKLLESGPTEAEKRKLILMEIDEDELEERKHCLNKYINQEMNINLKSSHEDNFKSLIDVKKWLNEQRFTGTTLVQKWIQDEFKFNYTQDEIESLTNNDKKILKRKKDRLIRNDDRIIDVFKFLDNKEDKDDEDDYESDSSSDSDEDKKIKDDVNTTNEEIILFSESEEEDSENEIDQAEIIKKLEQEKEMKLKLELQKMEQNMKKKRILKLNAVKPLNQRSSLIRGFREKVRATANETYCKEVSSKRGANPLTIDQLSLKLKIEEKCRQFIVMLKEHEEYVIQLEKYRLIQEREDKEFRRKQIRYDSDDSDDEFDENVDIGGKAEDYVESENEEDEEVGDMNDTIPDELKDVNTSVDMNIDNIELNEKDSSKIVVNDELVQVVVPVIKTYGRKNTSITTSSIDTSNNDSISNKDIHNDAFNKDIQSYVDIHNDTSNKDMNNEIDNETVVNDINKTNEVATMTKSETNHAVPAINDSSEENLSKELDEILKDNEDDHEEDNVEEEEEVLSPEEIKRIEKQKKQDKINKLRAMFEEDDRKHNSMKSSSFIDDQADEEDEFDNKQTGLGDFGFGVTNRDNEADALKIRKSDFDLIADDDDDAIGDEEAAVKARMEMELREDREQSMKVIKGVTEGFQANHNKKDKFFEDLVNTKSDDVDLLGGEKNGEVEEYDEEEVLLKKLRERKERGECQPEFDDDDDDFSDEDGDDIDDENIDLTEQEIQSRLQKRIEKQERKKADKIERKVLAEKSKMSREIRKIRRQESQIDKSNSQIINTRLISFDNDNDLSNQISPRFNTNGSNIADFNDESSFVNNDISNHGFEKQMTTSTNTNVNANTNTNSSNQVGVKRRVSAPPSKRNPTIYNNVSNKIHRSKTVSSNSNKVITSLDSNQMKRSNSAYSGVLDESDRFGMGMAVSRNIPSLSRQISGGGNSNTAGLTRTTSSGGSNAPNGSLFSAVTGLKRSISSVTDNSNTSNKLSTIPGSKRSFGSIAKRNASFNAGGAVSVAGAKYVFQISNNNENDGSMHAPSNNSNWGNSNQIGDSKMGSNGASATVPSTSNLIRSSSITNNSSSGNGLLRRQDSSSSLFDKLNSKNNATGGLKRGTSFRSLIQ
jgi:hypothetical protein